LNDSPLSPAPSLFSPRLDRALRFSALRHRHQRRKGSEVPYIQHPVAVAIILDRLGWPEDVVIAGLLHDAVEDTDATIDEVRAEFSESVAEIVGACTEHKRDASGNPRAWIDRKRDHIEVLRNAPVSARAVALADKLHNLLSIREDQQSGRAVHSLFNAPWSQVLWYYHTTIDSYAYGDERVQRLGDECRCVLTEIEGQTPPARE
jgi:(p)ppGpp synthase/HD superfamily hydrolase